MESDSTISNVVMLVFHALHEIEFLDDDTGATGWHLRWDSAALAQRGFKAAATAVGNDPVMVLSEDFCFESDFVALVHESIHMAQIVKGDLVPGFGEGYSVWKGKEYINLPFDDPNYFNNQPWESEVQSIISSVLTKISELQNA